MNKARFERQSFLGERGQEAIEHCVVGVIGAGGSGSHVLQQLSHLGFQNYVVYDGDIAEETNLNRVVTITEQDVNDKKLKVTTAAERIKGVRGSATVDTHPRRWQEEPEALRGCDLVFGCVDTFAERRELEVCCRRYMIPLIDIGLDLHDGGDEAPVLAGQVILSMPGGPCMWCLGFLTEENLGREAARYGAGGNPQVVWANGVLASTAIGIAVDLLSDWSRSLRQVVYLTYRANDGTVKPHPQLEYMELGSCAHFAFNEVGDPRF